MRVVKILLLGLLAAMLAIAAYGYWSARADPVVRQASIALTDWPVDAKPVRLLLASDIHLESAAMDGARLDRIVTQMNALRPDLVMLAGDFIEGSDPNEPDTVAPAMIAALRRLRAPMGIVAVLGNHDYWTDAPDVMRLLQRAGVTVLRNAAIVRGPLAIGGIDDDSTKHHRIAATVAALRGLSGARIMMAHSPDMARSLLKLPGSAGLLLAGHTHCGQIMLPYYGPPVDVVDPHYRCGIVRDSGLITLGPAATVAGPLSRRPGRAWDRDRAGG